MRLWTCDVRGRRDFNSVQRRVALLGKSRRLTEQTSVGFGVAVRYTGPDSSSYQLMKLQTLQSKHT